MSQATIQTLKITQVREAEGDYGPFFWANTNEGVSYTIAGTDADVAKDLGNYLNRPVKVLVQKGRGKYDKIVGIAEDAPEAEVTPQPSQVKPNGQVPPEIWEAKDRRITRMSVIKTAVEWLVGRATYLEAAGVAKAPNSDDVILLAKKFEKYVYENTEPQEKTTESTADENELPF